MVAIDEQSQMPEKHDEQIYYTIEQVATRTGLTKRTLRYYEEMGLLPPAKRTEGNYRRYTETDVQLVEQIKELRELLSFSLTEIRELLHAEEERGQIKQAFHAETDAANKIMQLDRADEILRMQIQLVEQKIAGLENMRRNLLSRIEKHVQTKNFLEQQIYDSQE
jgi:MerR family transcriptional regulator, repressor of the yfmOP operon